MNFGESSERRIALASDVQEEENILELKEKYKELKELLLLHRRYEIEALRNLRKGLTVKVDDHSKKGNVEMNSRENSRATRSAILQRRKLSGAFNKDYLSCLCSASQASALGELQQGTLQRYETCSDLLSISRSVISSSASSKSSSAESSSLRLPSLVSTALPRKLHNPRKNVNNTRYRKEIVRQSNPPIVATRMCLNVQSLSPRVKEGFDEDKTALNKIATENNCDESMDEKLLWIVPWMKGKETTPRGQPLYSTRENRNIKKRLSKTSEKDEELKYKKNVQFNAEAMHEIHLYSPMPVK